MNDLISREAVKKMLKNHRVDFSTEKDYRMARACVNAVPLKTQIEPQWISCSERLPERSGDYLVTRDIIEIYESEACVIDYFEADTSLIHSSISPRFLN